MPDAEHPETISPEDLTTESLTPAQEQPLSHRKNNIIQWLTGIVACLVLGALALSAWFLFLKTEGLKSQVQQLENQTLNLQQQFAQRLQVIEKQTKNIENQASDSQTKIESLSKSITQQTLKLESNNSSQNPELQKPVPLTNSDNSLLVQAFIIFQLQQHIQNGITRNDLPYDGLVKFLKNANPDKNLDDLTAVVNQKPKMSWTAAFKNAATLSEQKKIEQDASKPESSYLSQKLQGLVKVRQVSQKNPYNTQKQVEDIEASLQAKDTERALQLWQALPQWLKNDTLDQANMWTMREKAETQLNQLLDDTFQRLLKTKD